MFTTISPLDLALYTALLTMFVIVIGTIYYSVALVVEVCVKTFGKRKFCKEQSQQIIKNKLNKSIRRASGLTDKEFLFKYGFQK